MNYTEFAKGLAELSIASEFVDQHVKQFEYEIKRLLDKHAPVMEKMQIYRLPKPWFSENIHVMKRQVRRSEKLWRKYHQIKDQENFKTKLNKYHYALKHEK